MQAGTVELHHIGMVDHSRKDLCLLQVASQLHLSWSIIVASVQNQM